MPLINCAVNLILTWSANCVIVSTDVANQGATFTITETIKKSVLKTQYYINHASQLKFFA